jgi:radical SAM protein with 4Fe4S-binding SPASM domain
MSNPNFVERPDALVRHGPSDDNDPKPLYCVWEITLKCDLGCRHCGSRAGAKRAVELSTAECLDVVRQLEEVGFREVTLIGGEAYLREDWDQIAAEITRRGMVCTMTTGGRALDAERLKRAEAAGITSISVSVDGLAKTHDMQRGASNSWRDALDSCARIAKSSIRLTTNTQINRMSLPEIPALANMLADVGSKAWQIQLTVPMGRGADRPQLLLQPYDMLDVFPLLAWVKSERLTPNGIRLFPGNNVGYFGPYESMLRYGGQVGAHWSGCGAGKSCIGIESDGKIKGCPSLPPDVYTGGYTQQDSIGEVILNAPEVNHVRLRTTEDLWGFCKTCYYADVCRAGCTWTSHCTLGRSGNNPFCIHRALTYEEQGLHEHIVQKKSAPGMPFDHGLFDLDLKPVPASEPNPTILGHSLERIGDLDWREGSIWTDVELRDFVKKAPTLYGIEN